MQRARLILGWLVAAVAFLVVPVLAQDESVPEEVVTLVNGVVPVLMLVAVSLFKRIVPQIPRAVVPFLPTVVAPLILQVANMVAGTELASPLLTAQMGTIAIGMREMANWLTRGAQEIAHGNKLETFREGNRKSDIVKI